MMTTSLAALASNPSAHSSSTVLMSTSNANTSNSPLGINNTSNQSAMLIESAEYDSSQEIKTEFYTREGLWKLIKNGEFVRQQQSSYQQSQMSGQMTNGTSQISNNTNTNSTGSSNEPVKIAYFKYSNDLLFQHNCATNNSMRLKMQHKNYCIKCMKLIISNQQKRIEQNHLNKLDHDDDDDIVYNDTNQDVSSAVCKYCNTKLNSTDSLTQSNNASSTNTNNNSPHSLDVVVFNYAREIYFYEFNLFKSKSPSDMKNLIDKKVYRSFISTCFDVNLMASNLNTLDLQNKSVTKTDLTNNEANSNTTATNNTNTAAKINLSPSCLSLILAAGFNKGEIHVFDGFKKDASVFYNNNKLVDKSKVTCIKWLPNSMNLFLAGYSSGNIYLYDANNQTQPNAAPIFTKLYQDESFSVHINNHATCYSNSSNSTLSSTLKNPSSASSKSTPNDNLASNNNSSSSFSSINNNITDNTSNQNRKSQDKLILLSSNQQPVQVAKNPLLKWTIGASNSSTDTSSSSNEQVFFNTSSNCVGVNGVNEFAFSPCGTYLAVVSQDGFMRVFSFSYQSNQQMQIQLRCSMKSYFGGLLCVAWSSDGRFIATGGEDDLITIFSFNDMRVACRGRGHSSWINCVSFDSWTCLNNNLDSDNKTKTTNSKLNNGNNKYDDNDESDLEEFHTTTDLKNLNLNQKTTNQGTTSSPSSASSSSQQFTEQKKIVVSKKNRTISTLSDINYNPNNSSNVSSDAMFYRLASCGQDNQICFWDLTEECLKEKTIPHSRSRLTSIVQHNTQSKAAVVSPQHQLPQIIIQPSELINESNKILSQTIQQNQQQQQQIQPRDHHHTTSSIVSTARSLFSLKHNSNLDNKSHKKNNTNLGDLAETNSNDALISNNPNSSHKNGGLSLTSNFFKKHKRNASLTNASITNGLPEPNTNQNSANHKTKSKNNQVTLNSYKKSSNTINLAENIQHLNNLTDSSSNSKKQTSFNDSNNKTMIQSNNSSNSSFNLCPKLDEIPMVEPLVCKRIANERLTSIAFKEDCFMVSTQHGYVFTWARPASSSKILPQLNSEFRMNITSL